MFLCTSHLLGSVKRRENAVLEEKRLSQSLLLDMTYVEEYENDLATQTHSGPHVIDAERQQLNRAVFNNVRDIMPFDDIHKKSDCDLIYRFLIAKKWVVKDTANALREYMTFRAENKLNEILWEKVPEAMKTVIACDYSGFDKEGHPIFFDRPDPKGLGELLKAFSKDELMRVHYRMMEQGRRLCKMYQTDRVTCILDLSQLNMAILTNLAAMTFLKSMAHNDQQMYPENMRFMLICNGGWTFSSIYKVLKPLLDPRVQQKINFIGSGSNLLTDLDKFVPRAAVPTILGGDNKGVLLLPDEALRKIPVGTPPIVGPASVAECAMEYGSPKADAKAQLPVPDNIDPDDLS